MRGVVNAVRSLYRWGQDRQLVAHNPAALVRLPATGEKARDRVATPGEFARLLDALTLRRRRRRPTMLPVILSGRCRSRCRGRWPDMGRRASRRFATSTGSRSTEVLDAVELAADEEGRKPGGSWRVVPMVKPLRLRWCAGMARPGAAKRGQGLPAAQSSASGMLCIGARAAAGPRRLARARHGADRAARVAPHGGDLARPCGRLAEGRLSD